MVVEDELADSLELVPNIILNPGFEDDRPASPPMPRIFRNSFDDPFDYDSFDEPRWKRKMSVFFQGNTIKRNVIWVKVFPEDSAYFWGTECVQQKCEKIFVHTYSSIT